MTTTNDKYDKPIIIYERCHEVAFSTVGEEGDKTYCMYRTKTGEYLGFIAQWKNDTYMAWGTPLQSYCDKLKRPATSLHQAVMAFTEHHRLNQPR